MRQAVLLGFVGLCFLVVAAVPAAGLVQLDVPADSTAMDARVAADGDAAWTVTYRIELDTAERDAAFEDLQADIAANRSAYLVRFGERIGATVATAANATGRSMALRNLSVSTSKTGISEPYGQVSYAFEWVGFARVDDDGGDLHIGDALRGLYLDENTSLTLGWPAGYEPQGVTPAPTSTGDRSITWRGPRDFGPDAPAVAVSPAGGVPIRLLGVAAIVVIGAVGAIGIWWRRRGDTGEVDEAVPPGPTDMADTADADSEPPPELLSNEEQVLRLLEAEGGRVKQQAIASRLDWTDAKTSQVIGDLREADEVETFRIGRENVVTLPDQEL